jgi:hypothetical protein
MKLVFALFSSLKLSTNKQPQKLELRKVCYLENKGEYLVKIGAYMVG